LDRLPDLGVEPKGQIVICPGLNDGDVLDRSVHDLGERANTVDSVAIVPVGLTRYSSGQGLRSLTAEEARQVVGRARVWQRSFRKSLGRDFVYLSDELYFLAGSLLPSAARYDGYRQLQNGVGLTRLLLTDWAQHARSEIPDHVSPPKRVIWVCGRAAEPALHRMALDLRAVGSLEVEVLSIPNDFFGGAISVSGLLAGRDIVKHLRGRQADVTILPRSAFGFEGRQTLDGWTVDNIARQSGLRILLAQTADELLRATVTAES